MTDVIQTKTGFEIFKVRAHYEAGLQPLDKVENEIMNKMYMAKMDAGDARLSRRSCARKAT